MQTCAMAGCGQWAQWKMARPIKGPDPKDSTKQIVLRFETVGILCGQHKREIEAKPFESDLRFAFVGAVPDSVKFA